MTNVMAEGSHPEDRSPIAPTIRIWKDCSYTVMKYVALVSNDIKILDESSMTPNECSKRLCVVPG